MSRDRPRRNCPRIDYKEFSETGRKVVKEKRDLQKLEKKLMSLPIMATGKLFDEERKINLKLDRFIDEFEFDLLFDIEEIQEGISDLKLLLDKYEEIHIELERELEEEYEKKYKDFASKLGRMKDWIKGAKIEIKRRSAEEEEKVRKEEKEKEEMLAREKAEKEEKVRKEEKEKEELLAREKAEKEEKVRKEEKEREESLRKEKEEADERFRKQKNALRTKERYLRERIEQDIAIRIEIGSSFVEDIERNICDLKEYLREYSELFLQIEDTFGDEFEKEFANIYRDHSNKMSSHLRDMMDQLKQKKVIDAELKEENNRLSSLREKELKEREHEEKINIFNGIYENIYEHAVLLESKYKISLCSLSDSQTLEKAKEVKLLDAEFNDILDRAAELVKASPPDYDKTDEVLNGAWLIAYNGARLLANCI